MAIKYASSNGKAVYNASTPSLTDGQEVSLQTDINGNLIVTAIGGVAATSLGKAEDAAHSSGDTGVQMLAVRNDVAAALAGTTLDYIPLTTDANGALWVSQATALAGEDLVANKMVNETRFSFLNIAAGQATTTVKTGAGVLHSITFHGAATATNTTTIYDNSAASGTLIAIPVATAVTAPVTVIYDLAFSTGLTVITATANGCNMTFCFR